MFLKNKKNIFKIRRSKVTDYAALNIWRYAFNYAILTDLSVHAVFILELGTQNACQNSKQGRP